MNLVIDTSALLAVVTNEPTRSRLVRATKNAELQAPHSVHWEVGNAFSAMFKRGRVTLEEALSAVQAYQQIPLRFVEVSIESTLELSHQLDIYAYDAYVIACALQQRCPLLSLDRDLQAAATKARAQVLEIAE